MIPRTVSSPVQRCTMAAPVGLRQSFFWIEQDVLASFAVVPQFGLGGQLGAGFECDHAAGPVGGEVSRVHAVEQVPEDLGLADKRRDTALLQLVASSRARRRTTALPPNRAAPAAHASESSRAVDSLTQG